MPTTPKEAKRFLDLLAERGELPLPEVLAVFANKNGSLNRSAISNTLNFLWVEDLFTIVSKDGAEQAWIGKAEFDAPDDYVMHCNGFTGKENSISENYQNSLDVNDIAELDEHYRWCGVKQQEQLRVIGDVEDATLLAERIRAFAHYFAFNLTVTRLDRLAPLFSSRARDGQTVDSLVERITKLEKEFGVFEYFDHVHVVSVYNGRNANAKASAQMRLPAGIGKDERRGEVEFKLISVLTPNGVAVHDVTVYLAIIEEAQRFRVCDTDLRG